MNEGSCWRHVAVTCRVPSCGPQLKMEQVMKKLLATAALVALIASPAVAQSGKRHSVNPSTTRAYAQAPDRTDARRQVASPALNAYNASGIRQHGTWDRYGQRWDDVNE